MLWNRHTFPPVTAVGGRPARWLLQSLCRYPVLRGVPSEIPEHKQPIRKLRAAQCRGSSRHRRGAQTTWLQNGARKVPIRPLYSQIGSRSLSGSGLRSQLQSTMWGGQREGREQHSHLDGDESPVGFILFHSQAMLRSISENCDSSLIFCTAELISSGTFPCLWQHTGTVALDQLPSRAWCLAAKCPRPRLPGAKVTEWTRAAEAGRVTAADLGTDWSWWDGVGFADGSTQQAQISLPSEPCGPGPIVRKTCLWRKQKVVCRSSNKSQQL